MLSTDLCYKEEHMNVYDFDKTIYNGDSTVDFYFYCIKKYPKILLYLPSLCFYAVVFALGIYNKTKFKEKFYLFLCEIKDIDEAVQAFWKKYAYKIKDFYKARQNVNDVIISASPEFLLKHICIELGIKHLIASRVDKKTGSYTGENCYGEEKVVRLNQYYKEYKINEFYSDSLSDAPLAEISEKSFMVKGNDIIPWKDYQPSAYEKLKHIFLAREFLLFVIIGVINTINGVLFAFLYSLIFDANSSFALGYATSLSIAYLLNSKITFKENLSWNRYIKFCISYIPNFIIQYVVVIICYNLLKWDKLIAYSLAAAIGVPVTFIIMKFFAFKKK